jgi:MFS family permease
MFALTLFPQQIAWRAAFLPALILALFALFIRRRLPVSPRWLLGRSRFDEAQAIVAAAGKTVMESKGLKELPPAPLILIRQGGYGVWHQTRGRCGTFLGRTDQGLTSRYIIEKVRHGGSSGEAISTPSATRSHASCGRCS